MASAVAVVAGVAVLVATRSDPVLSPDSITYLSAADHVRGFDGYVDFTGSPLTHFPPLFPLLLAPGGRSLVWAAIVGALAAAAAAALLAYVLTTRVRWQLALIGGLLLGLSQATVWIGSTVWSETPFAAIALTTLAVLNRARLAPARAATGGLLAGLGFLTRYAGIGLVVAGLAMVIVATAAGGRRAMLRSAGAYLASCGVVATAWIVRNVVVAGEPFGPHFEGGAGESPIVLVRRLGRSVGSVVTDIDPERWWTLPAGYVTLIGLLVAVALVLRRRPPHVLDTGMAVFALGAIVIPVASRAVTATHIEARIASPVLIPAIYFAVVAANALPWRVVRPLAIAAAIPWWIMGVGEVIRGPDRLGGSAANPAQFSAPLYQVVDELPPDAVVLTNNPQRVWWHTGRVPIELAFTEPIAGNSHFPLSPSETGRRVCGDHPTYLAWFPGLDSTAGRSPVEVRPDLVASMEVTSVQTVPGGELFVLTATETTGCDPRERAPG